jgi:hypothetical protein
VKFTIVSGKKAGKMQKNNFQFKALPNAFHPEALLDNFMEGSLSSNIIGN